MKKRTFIAGLMALAVTPAMVRADETSGAVAAIQAEVEKIVATFMAGAGDLVKGLALPKVVIAFTPELWWIKPDGSEVHTAAWVQCPPEFQGFIASLLGDAPVMPPGHFFGEVFNAFLVPHEMSHFVDAKRNKLRNDGRLYDAKSTPIASPSPSGWGNPAARYAWNA